MYLLHSNDLIRLLHIKPIQNAFHWRRQRWKSTIKQLTTNLEEQNRKWTTKRRMENENKNENETKNFEYPNRRRYIGIWLTINMTQKEESKKKKTHAIRWECWVHKRELDFECFKTTPCWLTQKSRMLNIECVYALGILLSIAFACCLAAFFFFPFCFCFCVFLFVCVLQMVFAYYHNFRFPMP